MRLQKTRAFLVMTAFTLSCAGLPGYILPALGQSQNELRHMPVEFVTEPGCPIQVTSARTDVELDAFQKPAAARNYIDWQNSGSQPIVAIKFRIGYVLPDGNLHTMGATWPASAGAAALAPGASASEKWRGAVSQNTTSIKMRALEIKFADGSEWFSEKVKANAGAPRGGGGNEFAPMGADGAGLGQIADYTPGTPVPLTDTAKTYKQFPDRTQTGTVPLSGVPGGAPASGFQDNAFGGGAPLSATPTGGAPAFGGAAAGAPAVGAGGAPAMTPTAMPGAGAPNAMAPASAPTASTYTPPPKPPSASDIADPTAAFDSLMGNTSAPSLPSKFDVPSSATPAAGTATPAPESASPMTASPATATPTPAPVSATPAPVSATPAPVSATPAPVSATPAPISATPAPVSATPATSSPAPASAEPSPFSGSSAPPATPKEVDPFGS